MRLPRGVISNSLLLTLLWLAIAVPGSSQQKPVSLQISPPSSNGWVRINTTLASNTVHRLEATTNLITWNDIGTFHDALFNYPDAASPDHRVRFYRVRTAIRTVTNDWKNQILYPIESFQSAQTEGPDIRWVKFAILLNDPFRVFYQHSTNYPFHYEFATQRLPPFLGMSRPAFDAISLRRTNQQVVLGAVLFPPTPTRVEYGIQFVGLDSYPVEEVQRWFKLVEATVHAEEGAAAYYMPTLEQTGMAFINAAFLASNGIPVASIERWISANHCYSPGWALGRIKYFAAGEIDAAFADGRLLPQDILLTDGVPAETPLVAGIISLAPSTPNSHVAILSQSFGIPFVYLSTDQERNWVQGLIGHEIILRATLQFDSCEIKVLDVEGKLDSVTRDALLILKRPAPIAFSAKQTFGSITAAVENLVPTDIRFFGGKAANYSLLRRWVPTNSVPAIAFSFDLWDAFLDQTLPGVTTLRSEITNRLASYTNYPPDIAALKTTLAGIRDLFTQTARFTPAQQQAITNALRTFNPERKIRFRSSTNVEDSEHFTGAGLYDSYSGCLIDDLDGDTSGPSQCDPAEANERGVFRAIQKVYASFYNDNAFLERLRHGVDESKTGMGVLVHHSFPDEEELANGVSKLRFSLSSFSTNVTGDLVTQLGAESVTNPDGTSIPEVVDVFNFGFFSDVTLRQRSSRIPLGAYVMDWEADYRAFVNLFTTVGYGFKQFYPAKNNFFLDFEYKKDTNLGLIVKQVREVPSPGTTNQVVPFLIDEPTTYSVFEGEFGDVFANHRLKSLWALQTANLQLTSSNRAQGIYKESSIEFLENTNRQILSGFMTNWPNAAVSTSGTTNSWTTGTGTNQRRWEVETILPETVTGGQLPIITQQDLRKTVTVTYARPMPTISWMGIPETTTNETVLLEKMPELLPSALRQQRFMTKSNVMTIETSFYWPKGPEGASAGYTAPLISFVETRITGLTTNPIVLTNYYSQTYRPGHHNFTEEFIFEPRLEPGLAAPTLLELEAKNIQFIHVFIDFDATVFHVQGLDQRLRPL